MLEVTEGLDCVFQSIISNDFFEEENNYVSPSIANHKEEMNLGSCIKEYEWFMTDDDEKFKQLVGISSSRHEDVLISKASFLYKCQQFDQSLALWKVILQSRVDRNRTRFEEMDGIARCYWKMDHLPEALQATKNLTLSYPKISQSWFLLAQIQQATSPPHSLLDQLHSILNALILLNQLTEALIRACQIYKALNRPLFVDHLARKCQYHLYGRLGTSGSNSSADKSGIQLGDQFKSVLGELAQWANHRIQEMEKVKVGNKLDSNQSQPIKVEATCSSVASMEKIIFGEVYSFEFNSSTIP